MAFVETTVHDGVWVLTLQRPPVNAIDIGFVTDFHASLVAAAESAGCRAVVLTGAGAAFCAGIDVKAVPQYETATRQQMVRLVNRTISLLYGLPKPTVAAVNGHALGGGLVLVLACDRRLAAAGAYRLGLTEVTAGVPYPAAPMVVVRNELDPKSARPLVLTGEVVQPATPLANAFVDELCTPDGLLDAAIRWAAAASTLSSYVTVKRQLRAPALEEMRMIVEHDRDPMLDHWF